MLIVIGIILYFVASAILRRILAFFSVSSLDKKSVLITGCDTGEYFPFVL